MKGRFITVEGPDGSGKSSVGVTHLKKELEDYGYRVVSTREPGGCPLSEELRALILGKKMAPLTEMLLFAAARAEHLAETIIPGVNRGEVVISDRFSDSTYAYQVMGREMSAQNFYELEKMVVGQENQPNHTLFFDITPEESESRLVIRPEQSDRFDKEHRDFKRRIWEGYQARFEAYPDRMVRIDAMGDIESVKKQITHWVDKVFFPSFPVPRYHYS